MLKLGWFSTGTGSGSRNLLTHFQSKILDGSIDASIAFVFCNRDQREDTETDKFLDLVDSYHVPLETLSYRQFNRESLSKDSHLFLRANYDARVIDLIHKYNVDLIVLAGYMLIVSRTLSNTYKMINLHPALPDGPKGTWRQVIEHLIEDKTSETGTMVHLVTEDVDRGPCISFSQCDLRDLWSQYDTGNWDCAQLFESIRQKQFLQEPMLLAGTISRIASDVKLIWILGSILTIALPAHSLFV